MEMPKPRKLTKEELTSLVDYLRGSSNTLAEGMRACGYEECDEDDAAVRAEHDGEIFYCECGWWCETDEEDGDGLCEDCSTEDDDE